jgi:hypothetical protein
MSDEITTGNPKSNIIAHIHSYLANISRKYSGSIKTVSIIHFILAIVFSCLLFYYSYICEMDKYEIVVDVRQKVDNIIGHDNNNTIGIAIFLAIHAIFAISLGAATILNSDIKYYILNILAVALIVFTNLYYKGCLLRKYERQFFTTTNDPAKIAQSPLNFLISLFTHRTPIKTDQVLFVFIGFYIVSLSLLTKFIYMIYIS